MKAKLKEELRIAMKAKNQVRMDTIRSLLSAMQYEEMQKEVENLPEESILNILKSEIKKRKEEYEFAEKANRQDILEKLKVELATIEAFLPTQLGAEALEKIITDYKNGNPGSNMGGVMKLLKEQHAGQYDGKLASDIAKRIFG